MSPATADLSRANSTRSEEVCNMLCSWFEIDRDSLERAPENLNWGDPSNLREWAAASDLPSVTPPGRARCRWQLMGEVPICPAPLSVAPPAQAKDRALPWARCRRYLPRHRDADA